MRNCLLFLAIFLLPVGLFILGAYLGAILALYSFFFCSEAGIHYPYWILMVVVAVAEGVLAVILKKPVIVVASSFLGSWAIVTGIFTFIPLQPDNSVNLIPIATWIVLGFACTFVQYKLTAKKKLVQDRVKRA